MTAIQRYAVCALVVLAATASISRADDDVDNPAYKAWADFKTGSSQTLAGTMQAGPMTVEIETKSTLIEVTADHVVIEQVVTMTLNGQTRTGAPNRRTLDAKTDKVEGKELGEESIEAAGKTIKCKVVEQVRDVPGAGGKSNEHLAKVWFSTEIPGGVVQIKVESTDQDPKNSPPPIVFLLKAFEVK